MSQRPLSSSGGLGPLVGQDFLAVFVVSNTRRRRAVSPALSGSHSHNLAVDSARDAVLQLQVHLGNCIFLEYRRIGDVTNGGGFHHVTDGESLDGLIFGCASRAVGAADGLDVAAALLVTAVVLSLLNHDEGSHG